MVSIIKRNTCSNGNCGEPADYYCRVCEDEGHCTNCYWNLYKDLKTRYSIIRSCAICLMNAHTKCMEEREVKNKMEWVCDTCIKRDPSMLKADEKG